MNSKYIIVYYKDSYLGKPSIVKRNDFFASGQKQPLGQPIEIIKLGGLGVM